MSRYLMIDIGAGTMDILYYDDTTDLHYKAVVPSPARQTAELIRRSPGNLVITGCEMGGSPVSDVLKERAQSAQVIMSASAAATVHHNLDRVRAAGIRIVADDEVEKFQSRKDYQCVRLADVDTNRIKTIIQGIGVPFEFDAVCVCAQDHGRPPAGVNHLDFRHRTFRERLDNEPFAHTLLFQDTEVPDFLSRLGAIARSTRQLPTAEVYVMDSGMAAILGASMDTQCRHRNTVMVLDIATSHTVGAVMVGDELDGFFEYHTHDVTVDRLDVLLQDLPNGQLDHKRILSEGGHGAYTRKAPGFDAVEIILSTGPKRRLIDGSRLPITLGAPWGDNMMTGTVGLLEAFRRRKSLASMAYI